MSEWMKKPLGDLLELVIDHRGKTPKKMGFDDFHESGYPVLSAKHVKTDGMANIDTIRFANDEMYQKWMKIEVEEGDIVLTSEAPMGEVFYIAGSTKYVLGQRVFGLRPNKDLIEPLYLLAWLASRNGQEQLVARASGSTVLGIKQSELLKIEVDVPPKAEQLMIAKNRQDLALKIELNRQTNQTLEYIAQAIFKSWFVDFEPTRAKATIKAKGGSELAIELAAQAIICGAMTLEEVKQLDSEYHQFEDLIHPKIIEKYPNPQGLDYWQPQQLKTTAALFPDALLDSEQAEIPEGWEWSEIGNEVAVVGGGTPSTKNEEFWEGGRINWTSPKDMSNLTDKILLETGRKVTEAGLAKISSGLLPENTVLMSSRAPVGYLAISKIRVAVNQGYIAMKCEDRLSPEYVVQWVESVMDDIKQRASGTTFAEISKKNFKIIPVIVPESELISEYSKVVSNLYDKITKSLRETKSLSQTRDSLLPKLLSGEMEFAGQLNE